MGNREVIQSALRRLSRRLRLVRAVTAGSRFLVIGLLLALAPLLAKGILPDVALWIAAGLIAGLALMGLLYGSLLRARPAHIARLADRHLGLKERITCAVEHLASRDQAEIVQAQLAETATRIRTIHPRDAFPFRLTPEVRIAGPLAALVRGRGGGARRPPPLGHGPRQPTDHRTPDHRYRSCGLGPRCREHRVHEGREHLPDEGRRHRRGHSLEVRCRCRRTRQVVGHFQPATFPVLKVALRYFSLP